MSLLLCRSHTYCQYQSSAWIKWIKKLSVHFLENKIRPEIFHRRNTFANGKANSWNDSSLSFVVQCQLIIPTAGQLYQLCPYFHRILSSHQKFAVIIVSYALSCHFPCVASVNQCSMSFTIADFNWWVPGNFVPLLYNHCRADSFTSRPQCPCTAHVQSSCGSIDMASHNIKITLQHNEWQAARLQIFSICSHCHTWHCIVNLEGNG